MGTVNRGRSLRAEAEPAALCHNAAVRPQQYAFLKNPPALAVGSDGAEPPDGPLAGDRVEWRQLATFVARKFRIPESDARLIAREVLLSYSQSTVEPARAKAWIVSAACNASRQYWRSRPKDEDVAPHTGDRASVVRRLLLRIYTAAREWVRVELLR